MCTHIYVILIWLINYLHHGSISVECYSDLKLIFFIIGTNSIFMFCCVNWKLSKSRE